MTSTSLPKWWRRQAYRSSMEDFRLGIPSFSNLRHIKINHWFNPLNKPRSIYHYSNISLRLSGQTSTFGGVFLVSKSLLEIKGQKTYSVLSILLSEKKIVSHVQFISFSVKRRVVVLITDYFSSAEGNPWILERIKFTMLIVLTINQALLYLFYYLPFAVLLLTIKRPDETRQTRLC